MLLQRLTIALYPRNGVPASGLHFQFHVPVNVAVYGVLLLVVSSDASFAGNSAPELVHFGFFKFGVALIAWQYERGYLSQHDSN